MDNREFEVQKPRSGKNFKTTGYYKNDNSNHHSWVIFDVPNMK